MVLASTSEFRDTTSGKSHSDSIELEYNTYTVDEVTQMSYIPPTRTCKRDTCSNRAGWKKGYCSKKCAETDNPVEAGIIDPGDWK